MKKLEPKDLKLAAIIMSSIWARINTMVFQNKFKVPQLVLNVAKSEFDEYCSANHTSPPTTSMRAQIRWTLLGLEKIKLNEAALVDKMSMKMEIGIIISHALLRALDFCLELDLHQVELEGDALAIIHTIKNENKCLGLQNDLIKEAKQYLKTQSQWILNFSHREGNLATHVLAKFGLSLVVESVWIKKVSNILLSVVTNHSSQ